jgi:hypothetical protein
MKKGNKTKGQLLTISYFEKRNLLIISKKVVL